MKRRKPAQMIAALCAALAILIPVRIAEGSSPSPQRHRAVQVRSDQWQRINEERIARGLPTLTWNGRLSERAETWSEHMHAAGHIFHSNLGRLVLYNYAGENVASGSAGVTSGNLGVAFMRSQDHRDNILSPGFTSAGVGVYCAKDHSMWITVLFGRKWTDGARPAYNGGTSVTPIVRTDPGHVRC